MIYFSESRAGSQISLGTFVLDSRQKVFRLSVSFVLFFWMPFSLSMAWLLLKLIDCRVEPHKVGQLV